MVEVLADTLRRPHFPAEHLERVSSQKLVRIQEREQDTQQVANLRFYETIYGDHPYGRPTSGYAETVSAIQREDLLAFHAGHYAPQGAVIVVTGDVRTEAAIDLIRAQFEDWRADAAGSAAVQQMRPRPTASIASSIRCRASTSRTS